MAAVIWVVETSQSPLGPWLSTTFVGLTRREAKIEMEWAETKWDNGEFHRVRKYVREEQKP